MKKISNLLMTAAMVIFCCAISFRASAQTIVVSMNEPYSEKFEDSTAFANWTQEGGHAWVRSTTQVHNDTYSCYLSAGFTTDTTWLISPVLDLSSLTGPAKLSFYHRQATNLFSASPLHVYYRTNPAEDWIPLHSYTTVSDVFVCDSIFLPTNPAYFQLAFQGITQLLTDGIYLDDILLEGTLNCLAPMQLTIDDFTSTMATVSWNPQGSANDWDVEYGLANYTPGTGTLSTVSNVPSATLTGLASGTAYDVYVRSNCGGGSTSEWVGPVSFTTPCDAVTVTVNAPYTEDFGSYTASTAISAAGPMANCWSYIYSGSTAGYEPKVFNGTYSPTANDNALAITSGRSTLFGLITLANAGDNNFAVLPEFSNALNELQLLFTTAMSTDTAGVLTLGFLTNATDASTFTPICDIPSNNYATTPSANHVYDLSNYPVCNNVHARIAFRWTDASTSATSTVCIDNVNARIALSCAEPTDVTISAIAATTANVDWTPGSASQSQWEVECNGVTTTATTHPFTLTGLTPSTDYTVRVRAICGTDDYSYWTLPVSFTSACPTITIDDNTPFEETFTTQDLGCWMSEVLEASDNWEVDYSAHTGAYGITYSNSMFGDLMNGGEPTIMDFLSMFGGMMNFGTGSARIISPILDNTALTVPTQLTFFRRQHSMMIPLTLHVYYRTSPNSNWAWIAQYTNTTTDWNRESVNIPATSSELQIAFVSYVDMENMGDIMGDLGNMTQSIDLSSVIDIDDIRVGASSDCEIPTGITISNVTTNSATVTWEGGNASSWNLEYGPRGFAHGSGTMVTANNNVYTLTGLTENTEYDVYVQGVCSSDNISDWSVIGTFTTLGTGITEYNRHISVFPNPTTGTCFVDCEIANGQIAVYDVFGKLLLNQEIVSNRTELNLNDLAAGIYTVKITNSDNVVSSAKIVVGK
ncbi:MAG: fibronectin type III domain-containing protein [Bacteroidales bacterium]|nr:fibronectin type III domain-containing protein [Bacteroidales bacterium]